jgi:putative membrane protein
MGPILATLNASLNATAALLLVLGLIAIKMGKKTLHQKLMGTALLLSVIFLISYLIRFYLTGVHRFPGEGTLKTVYLTILLSHITLAAITPFLAVRTFYLAYKERFEAHKKLARITWPIWMYVSVTGVVVYWMLYQLAHESMVLSAVRP